MRKRREPKRWIDGIQYYHTPLPAWKSRRSFLFTCPARPWLI